MSCLSEQLKVMVIACLSSPIGKHLPNAFYFHRSALSHLSPLLQEYQKQGDCFEEAPKPT